MHEHHCCCHEHCHSHSHDHDGDSKTKETIIKIAVAGLLLISAIYFKRTNVSNSIVIALYALSYLICGSSVLLSSVKNVWHGHYFDENFLMSIASIGACIIGEYSEGVAVMLFYSIGTLCEEFAEGHSKKSISALVALRPDFANLVSENGELKSVNPKEIKTGEVIAVKAGERIPLDGIIIDGSSAVDTSAMTGESMPREVNIGSEVLSGYVNKSGLIRLKVIREYEKSAISRIIDLVTNAGEKKAKAERFITKFAKYYTPTVLVLALLVALIPPLAFSKPFSVWVYRALIFLVTSCPCALVLSIPLTFFSGIGLASKNGILIKGSSSFEILKELKYVIFDKTGTLTTGKFKVVSVKPEDGLSEKELIKLAAVAENNSNHPVAVSINEKAKECGITVEAANEVVETAGKGIKAVVGSNVILVGNSQFMENHSIKFNVCDDSGTIVYVAENGIYKGCLVIADGLKVDSKDTIEALKQADMKVAMLTGDNKRSGAEIAVSLGITHVYTELLPEDKVEIIEKYINDSEENERVAFIGDGINDAPVLARADLGITMGGLGSDAALEASDIVLMTDEPSKILTAIDISKKVGIIVKQNIFFSISVKIIIMLLGALGFTNMWAAVFADVGVLILTVFNSLRIFHFK